MKQASEFTSVGQNDYQPITVNGVEVTVWKRWAVALMKREAGGEQIESISREAWREVLGFGKEVTAGQALKVVAG